MESLGIFTNVNGDKLKFYISPCKERESLQRKIIVSYLVNFHLRLVLSQQENGGEVVVRNNADDIIRYIFRCSIKMNFKNLTLD